MPHLKNFPNTQYTRRKTQYTRRNTQDAIHNTPYAIRNTPYAIRHTPYAIRHTQYTIRKTQYTIRKTQYAIRNTTYDVSLDCAVVTEPNIDVDPSSMSATQGPDESTEQTLTISNVGAGDLEWTIDEEPVILEAAGTHEQDARHAPSQIGRSSAKYVPNGLLLDEGFEGGVMPPDDWTQEITNADFTWKIQTVGTPYNGVYSADIEYDPDLVPQDEWLLSPELELEEGTLSFWSYGSLYWCRDTNDNCDLKVWLVVGDVGGDDDIFVGTADEDWVSSFVWAQSVFDLTPLLPGGAVRIGLQYVGIDGAQIGLDDIQLDNVSGGGSCVAPSDIAWLSLTPDNGTTGAGMDDDVTVTFDSTGMDAGTYNGNLCVNSNDPNEPLVVVPVSLTVKEPLGPDPLTCNGPMIEFEAGIPSDWTTASTTGNVYWSTTDDLAACDNGGNQTNGDGQAACADSDETNEAGDPYSAELWSNAFDIDAQWDSASLNFEAAYRDINGADMFEVDISMDGGSNWDNLLSWDENHYNPGESVSLDLSAYAGETGLIVRYHYFGDGWDWYAHVDDVMLECSGGATAPDIEVEPTEMEATHYPDEMSSQTLTISNTGDADLMWDISSDVDWATVDVMSGTTAAGESSDVMVTFDSTDVMSGTYTGTLSIASNDPDEGMIDVSLTLTVEEEPQADVEVEISDIIIDSGEGLSQTLTIRNTGNVDFNWEAFTEDTTGQHGAGACSGTGDTFPGTTLDPDAGTTLPGEATNVTMETDTTDVEAGNYTGNVCIRNTDTGNVIVIPLSMTVSEPTAVEMAELSTPSSNWYGSLAFVIASMIFLVAGGYVAYRRGNA